MAYIEWQDDYATGIKVIDGQHLRIIEYINGLDDARHSGNQEAVAETLANLVDYTLSHFAFEESLMQDVGYAAFSVHVQTHDSFRERIAGYQSAFRDGQDVTEELLELLGVWLFEHIAKDDQSYVPAVKVRFPELTQSADSGWLRQKIAKFFG